MKSFNRLKGVVLSVIMFAFMSSSQAALAGSYMSTINLPVLHAKGFAYKANFPIPRGAKPGGLIKHVSWNWNVHGWPRGLQVYLCQTAGRCLDVSRLRSGASVSFERSSATQPFYFQLKLSPSGPAPIAGQQGTITVTW
ncbi:flagellar protein FlhE [Pseudomonas sp. v388]|uniref:flagellar protein FlhE n=1 Tax=Pseudomonas sp. v388 TaxID=2479849 RepID=UPI000F7B1CDD|nr:flagellar protein FlhE [Pseudomonas sp. v388]RRV08425.1 flagellar protein FlhE [Pseudomonas sp. v388]